MNIASFLDLPDGIHERVPDEVYHQRLLGVASKGALDRMLESPASYRAWLDGQLDDDTEAMFFGRAGHCYVLEEDAFRARYVVEPDFGYLRKHDESGTTSEQAKDNKKRRDDFRVRFKGATFVTAAQYSAMVGIRGALSKDPDVGTDIRALWKGDAKYRAEVTMKWECPSTGLICRARDDLLFDSTIVDIKTTADCRLDPFNRSRKAFGYERQEAHYRAGAAAVGRTIDRFLFVAVERVPPFHLQVYELDPELLLHGQRQIERAKLDLVRCITFDDWPGLEPGVKTLRLLPWESRAA